MSDKVETAKFDVDAVVEHLRTLIDENAFTELLAELANVRPADIAAVMERLDRVEQTLVLDALEPEIGSEVVLELEESTRKNVLEEMSDSRIAQMADELESDDAADLVGELDDDTRARVLEQVPQESRDEVERLLTYDDDSAGGIMKLEAAWVRQSHSVAKAVEMVREHYREMDEIHEIFVVDRDHVLRGVVTPTELLLANPEQTVADIMDSDNPVTIHPEEDQAEAARLARRYDRLSLPVVDERGRLLGIITHDDIFDVIEEEEQEDISYMAGTGLDAPAERSVLKAVFERGPWLLVGLVGGILGALVMSGFEEQISIEHALFLPAIMAMAGSVAIQASSLVVRGLATDSFALQGLGKTLFREFRVSILFGLGLGALLGICALGLSAGNRELSACVSVALVIVVINAALLGTLIPVLLHRLGKDPAVATGPFITTLNDVLGILTYLLVLTILL